MATSKKFPSYNPDQKLCRQNQIDYLNKLKSNWFKQREQQLSSEKENAEVQSEDISSSQNTPESCEASKYLKGSNGKYDRSHSMAQHDSDLESLGREEELGEIQDFLDAVELQCKFNDEDL